MRLTLEVGELITSLPKLLFDLLIELLTDREDPLAKKVLPLLAEAKSLTPIRNLVAHEPLMLSIYVDPGKEDIRVETRMSSSKGGRVITFNDLVTWRAHAEQVTIKLTAAYYGNHPPVDESASE